MLKKYDDEDFNMANIMQYELKNYVEANRLYLKVIASKPNFIDALNNHAQNLRLNFKNYDEAIKFYTKVIDINPLFENAYFRRGICKGSLNDLIGQIEDYSRNIEINKPRADAFISRALISFKAGKYEDVIRDCRIAIELGGKNEVADGLIISSENKIKKS
ncbi:MAG: hypothetical protein EOP00_10875 [Pedobacter sp.]|nr:MAG: hypothetical protein EOP00_10875 [Pedobacter sp.]